MNTAYFHFYGELSYFLLRNGRDTEFEHQFDWRASIKDMIESFGVPHSSIELLVVNGESTDFNVIVDDMDTIQVYPRFHMSELDNKMRLRPPVIPQQAKFILDTHLGRLAAYLRMMGFDTLYRNDYDDDELAQVAHDEDRILLSRDIGLLKRALVVYGYFVRALDPKERIVEIMRRFNLAEAVIPFKRCMKCNGLLETVDKAAILHRLQPGTARHHDEFHRCQVCDRIYWPGPHYQKMQHFMNAVLERLSADAVSGSASGDSQ